MKVIKDFFCVETKVSYKFGDDYSGSRKDLGNYLEKPKRKTRKTKIETKELKTEVEDK